MKKCKMQKKKKHCSVLTICLVIGGAATILSGVTLFWLYKAGFLSKGEIEGGVRLGELDAGTGDEENEEYLEASVTNMCPYSLELKWLGLSIGRAGIETAIELHDFSKDDHVKELRTHKTSKYYISQQPIMDEIIARCEENKKLANDRLYLVLQTNYGLFYHETEMKAQDVINYSKED